MTTTANLRLSFRTIRTALNELDLTIVRKYSTNEWRVNFKNGAESTAYYTNDLEDAYNTGIAMYVHRANN